MADRGGAEQRMQGIANYWLKNWAGMFPGRYAAIVRERESESGMHCGLLS